ncbi:MAG: hypothetical protein ABSB32_06885 [Thermodesulfobacteriota bacterium]
MFGGIGILLVLLFAFLLLLPYFINLEPVKERILAFISQKVGGQANFQRVDISFFPHPKVVILQPSLSITGKVTGSLASATVYPQILSLLRGKIQICRIQIEAPNITLPLPERLREKEERSKTFSPAVIGELVTPLVALMESDWPNLTVRIEKGRLNLLEASQSIFWFQDIKATIIFPPERLEIELTCQSNLWEDIHIKGWLDARKLKGKGRIDLTGLRPNLVTSYLSPLLPLGVGDSRIDLQVSFETDGQRTLQAEVKGSIPYLTLHRGNEKWVIKGGKLKGSFQMEGNKTAVSLTEFNVDDPRVEITGKLDIDSAAPFIRVELEGREIEVTSMRKAALALAGDVPLVQEIFEIVKGGKIPLLTFQTHGRSMDDLGKIDNLFIRGNMVEGKVFLSEAMVGRKGLSFGLDEVKGEVIFSKGFLEGKSLEARWGEKIKVKEGVLRLGLEGRDIPFHLEANFEVDLAQILPLLKKLAKDENVLKEINLIQEIKGKARGKWILGERLKAIKVTVDVHEINLVTRYAKIPYLLEIQSGQVSYDGKKVGIRNLNVKLGRSSLSGFAARFDLKAEPYLEILSGKSAIFMDEIFPLLSSWDKFRDVKKDLKSLKGAVAVSNLDWKGPLFHPEKWRFRIAGKVENLSAEYALLPGSLSVPGAKFEITPERVSLSDARMRILDASFRAAGVLQDYQQNLRHLNFTFNGDMGSQFMEWISDQIHLPEKFRVRPLSISQARVIWDRNGKTSLTGDIAGKAGPRIFIDMFYQAGAFSIKHMRVQDEKSQATLALALQKREFRLDFRGNLEKTTLDQFLLKNQIFTGSLKGDFRAHILMDQPLRSTAQGKLQGTRLDYLLPLPVPVLLNQISLDAARQKIKVESASCTWDDQPFVLNGDINFSGEGLLLNLKVSADGFKWKKVGKELKKEDQKKDSRKTENQKIDSPKDKKAQLPPVRGKIGVELKYFEYEKYTLQPLYADLLLDPDGMKVIVHEANLCGISMPGVIKLDLPDISLDFQVVSRDQELKASLECLVGNPVGITGIFDVQGKIAARGKPEDLVQSLQGNFDFGAKRGRIDRESLIVHTPIHEQKMGVKLGDTFWGMCTLINPLDWSQNSTSILQAASRADFPN